MSFVNNCLKFLDEDEFLRLFRFELKNLYESKKVIHVRGKRSEKVICEFTDLYNVFRKSDENSFINKMFQYLPQNNYEKSESDIYKIYGYKGNELILSLEKFEKFLSDFPHINIAELSSIDAIYWDDAIMIKYYKEWDWISFMRSNSYYEIESILEDYCGIINWEILCSKALIEWDEKLIEKYIRYIRFDVLSRNPIVKWTPNLFKSYADKWILNEDNCYIGFDREECRGYSIPIYTNFFEGFLMEYFDREEVIVWLEKHFNDSSVYLSKDLYKIINELNDKIDCLRSKSFEDRKEHMWIYNGSSKIRLGSNDDETISEIIEKDYRLVFSMIENEEDFCLCRELFSQLKNTNFYTIESMSTANLNYIESLEEINNIKNWIYKLLDEDDFGLFEADDCDCGNDALNSAFDGDETAYWNWRNE